MTDLEKFLVRYHAEGKRRGLESSGIMGSTEKMDSSDTTRYDVVMIPRRPQPKEGIPKSSSEV